MIKAAGVGGGVWRDPPPRHNLMDESDDDLDNMAERVPNNSGSSTTINVNNGNNGDSFKSPSLAGSEEYRVSAAELAGEALDFKEDVRFGAKSKIAASTRPKPSPRPRKAPLNDDDDEDWMPELERPPKKARSGARASIGGSASKAAMANIMRADAAAKPARPRAKAKTLTPQQRLMNKMKMKKFGRRR